MNGLESALTGRIFVKAAREMQERVTKYKETIAVSRTAASIEH